MSHSMEEKLDEDFLFYLTFIKHFFRNLLDKCDVELCQAWLKRLCSEESRGVAEKRCRNIYLSQLVLAMQEGKLRGPFENEPPEGPLVNPQNVFGPQEQSVIEPPAWLSEVVEGSGGDMCRTSHDGRTYLATRNLGKRGAFGCVAVNTEHPLPLWRSPAPASVPASAPSTDAPGARQAKHSQVRLAGGGSLHDVAVRLAGGSDRQGPGELRFAPPPEGSSRRPKTAVPVARRSAEPRPAQRPVSAELPRRGNGPGDGDVLRELVLPPPPPPAQSLPTKLPPPPPPPPPPPSTTQPPLASLFRSPHHRFGGRVALQPRRTSAYRESQAEAVPATSLGRLSIEDNRQDMAANAQCLLPCPRSRPSIRPSTANAVPRPQLGPAVPPLQVMDNLRHMLVSRPTHDDRIKVLEFYKMLIENVDAVKNGTAQPIPEVANLLNKINLDLKGVLARLDEDDHNRAILNILHEKLVRRITEIDERERKLENAEKLLLKPPEEISQTQLDVPSPLSDVLWHEAVNQTPKRQNLIKLQGMYDEALVGKFVELLAREKGKIIERFKQQYEKSVQYLKHKLQEKISDAVTAYITAREDWADTSSLLDNVQSAQIKDALCTSEFSNEHWQVFNQLMDHIRESQELYESEIQRGEDLRMILVAEHQSSHLMKLIAGNNLQQLQNDHSELCDAIHQLVSQIKQQHRRIDELQNFLCS